MCPLCRFWSVYLKPDFDQVLRKVGWRLLPFMFLLYIISYLDRINISFVGLDMSKSLGFSDEVFGWGAGIFFIGYCLFGVPSNLILSRVGARRWIAVLMVAWGIISVSMAFVQSIPMFYAMRFLLGVAESGFFPGMVLYLTYWFPKQQHGRAVARFMTAIPVAGIAGSIIAARLLNVAQFCGLAGWKWLFIVTGSPSIILGAACWFFLTDSPSAARWLSDDERKILQDRLAEDRGSAAASATQTPVLQVIAKPLVWLLALLYFLLTLGMYGFQLWLPQILFAFKAGSTSTTAMLTVIPAIFQALGMEMVARRSDKSGERKFHLATSACIAGAGLALAGMLTNPSLALAALCATAFGIWGTVGPFWAFPRGYLAPDLLPTGIGLINSVGNLGGCAGPALVGMIKHHSTNFSLSLWAMAASLLLAAFLPLVLPSPDRSATDSPTH